MVILNVIGPWKVSCVCPFSSSKKFLSLLFSKQAEIDRKKAEVRARLEAQAGGHSLRTTVLNSHATNPLRDKKN